jgi:alcohol dehydrogenase, propanol-preferring
MRAIVFNGVGQPLVQREVDLPEPGPGSVRLSVRACGVCRTDLHIVAGELRRPKLPLVLGHQIVGTVDAAGAGVRRFEPGQRVGVPWLGWTCGRCRPCLAGRENLCDEARFTGYDLDGGFADATVADERYCFPIHEGYADVQAAPLLCAGLIGFRAYTLAGEVERLGLYGFGAAAHILCQIACAEGRRVFAFTKPGDEAGQAFARSLGATWAGGAGERPPEELDAAIIFAPAGELVPEALAACAKGGTVVCAGIHMSEIPSFPYELLWGERSVRSVANLTRADGEAFMRLAPQVPVQTSVTVFPLEQTGAALEALRRGRAEGAVVVAVAPS